VLAGGHHPHLLVLVVVGGVSVGLRWPVMTLDGLVAEAGEALGRARSLFGPAAFGVGFASTPALQSAGVQVGSGVGESGGLWQGGAGSGYRRGAGATVQALDSTIGADAGAGGGVVQGGGQAASGRAGANGVVADARNGVAAIAPATGTRAGKDELVAHPPSTWDSTLLALTANRWRSWPRSPVIAGRLRHDASSQKQARVCMDAVGLTGDAEATCENLGQWL